MFDTPSVVLINGKIWTVNKKQSWAEAVAISGNKIIAVGNSSQIKQFIGPKTEVIDLKGKFALPGFNDAHVHFADGSFALESVDLRDASDEQDFVQRVQNYTQKIPPNTWILRGNWNHENWQSRKLPTKELIDPVTPNHPVFINRLDLHLGLANSLALKLAGIDRDTPDPPGGEIRRDPKTGESNGILIDRAWDMILRVVPPASFEQTKKILKHGLNYAAKFGVTSFQDNSSAMDVRVYQALLQEGQLTARVNAWRLAELLDEYKNIGITADFGNDMLHLGTIKIYTDGSMGAHSALFHEPYTDDPSIKGLAIYNQDELNQLIESGDAAGLQLVIHAIGDKANTLVLDALEQAYQKNGHRHRRHRIEHAQVVTPTDLKRYKKLGIIASIQPSHCIDDLAWAEQRIGYERCKNAYRVGSFLNSGIPIAIGTDWAVEPLNPLLGLYAAVTRENIHGNPVGGWFPSEKITIEQAIEGYTLGSAYAEFAEHKKGSIEAGKLADVVVLSQNLLKISPKEYLSTEVLYTIVDGKVVYKKNNR